MRKISIIIALLVMSSNLLFSLGLKEKENKILEIIEEKSFFNDFKVIDEKVLIECKITIKNNSDKNLSFKINAVFEDDVNLGLLKYKTLEGYKNDLINNIFTISANEIIEYCQIIFIGESAGNYQKANRNLPKEINIILLE